MESILLHLKVKWPKELLTNILLELVFYIYLFKSGLTRIYFQKYEKQEVMDKEELSWES